MFKLIGKLQRKPKHVRDQIAFWSAAAFVLPVFLVWSWHRSVTVVSEQSAVVNASGDGWFSTIRNEIEERSAAFGQDVVVEEVVTPTNSISTTQQSPVSISPEMESAPVPNEVPSTQTTAENEGSTPETEPTVRYVRIATTSAETE